MPIRKPIPATIDATDFRNKAYSFAVESVLAPMEIPGIVVVSVSTGYWLTTSLTDRPKREQTIAYCKQPDGSWMASDAVTVVHSGNSPTRGTVTIRNSPAETVVLTIDPVSTAIELAKNPMLTVSQPALNFAPASPGNPSFQVITVSQHHADEPVTLTTDAPDYFQLASDSRPNFAPTLTCTPSVVGTYVHVRYMASHRGFHSGQLTIQSSYDSKTIPLNGPRSMRLPTVRATTQATSAPAQPGHSGKEMKGVRRGIGLLALLIGSSLTYTGYMNRCQLFPGLCQEMKINQPVMSVARPEPVAVSANYTRKKTVEKEKSGSITRKNINLQTQPTLDRRSADGSAQEPPTDRQKQITASRTPIVQKKLTNQTINDAVNNRPPIPPTEESELERELNQPTRNQL